MTGSIRPRGPGTWQLVADAGTDPVTGKRRQVFRTVKGTKREAKAALAALVVELGRGEHTGSDATVAVLVDRHLRQSELSPTTRADYERVRRIVVDRLGSMPVVKVRAEHIDQLYADLTAAGVSPARIRRLHNLLSGAFRRAVRWRWVPYSPVAGTEPPAVERPDIAPPDPGTLARLLAAAEGDFAVLLRLAVLTGARRGELVGLQWGDVDLDAPAVTIRRAVIYTPSTGVVVKSTKTARPRVVAIDPGTVAVLRGHRRTALERALTVGVTLAADAFLFAQDAGATVPWRPDYVTFRYDRLRRRLGVTTRFHDLRHAHATQLLAAGVDVRTVSSRLGHARTSTTLDIYAAVIPARDRDAAETMGRLLEK